MSSNLLRTEQGMEKQGLVNLITFLVALQQRAFLGNLCRRGYQTGTPFGGAENQFAQSSAYCEALGQHAVEPISMERHKSPPQCTAGSMNIGSKRCLFRRAGPLGAQ